MDTNNINTFLFSINDKIPSEYIPIIRKKLESKDDNNSVAFLSSTLKDPTIALVLSIFLGEFGIDRFYIGDTQNGVIKLIVGLLISFIIGPLTFGLGYLLFLGYIIDWFLIMGATKKKNFEKLNMAL